MFIFSLRIHACFLLIPADQTHLVLTTPTQRKPFTRVTRNIHTVSPNTTRFNFGSISSIGSVEGLFPCGALVNHSCQPNSHFHCVAKASPSADGRPVIEQVLRTTRKLRAGEELCYSYLSDSAAATVLVRTLDGLRGVMTRRSLRATPHSAMQSTPSVFSAGVKRHRLLKSTGNIRLRSLPEHRLP